LDSTGSGTPTNFTDTAQRQRMIFSYLPTNLILIRIITVIMMSVFKI